MGCTYRRLALATFSLLLFANPAAADGEKEERLSIEQAKFKIVQLYGEEKISLKNFTVKYPELHQADEANRAMGKKLREAAQAHPQLKGRFDKIKKMKISIPEKMKLWQPLFAEAETIGDLDPLRKKYDEARIHALRLEIDALRSEGYTELATKMDTIFRKIEDATQ